MHAVGDNPVSFEEIGGPEAPTLAEAYAAGAVVVLSSVVEGFPISLVEAMFCGRATVSTDVGAVVEIIGGTGLVVPPRNPRALAEACVALLRDPARRERLGAAARARALELFTVEQNVEAFHGIYLEVVSRCPVQQGGPRRHRRTAAVRRPGGGPRPRPLDAGRPGRGGPGRAQLGDRTRFRTGAGDPRIGRGGRAMSELGELDRPGTPDSPGAWDEHSQEWLTGAAETDVRVGETTPTLSQTTTPCRPRRAAEGPRTP